MLKHLAENTIREFKSNINNFYQLYNSEWKKMITNYINIINCLYFQEIFHTNLVFGSLLYKLQI